MNSYFQFTLENKKQHNLFFIDLYCTTKFHAGAKKMGFLSKHGESCNERTFPKFFHIILLLIYFQVWCKEVFFPLIFLDLYFHPWSTKPCDLFGPFYISQPSFHPLPTPLFATHISSLDFNCPKRKIPMDLSWH
jgi:hypothetical protein